MNATSRRSYTRSDTRSLSPSLGVPVLRTSAMLVALLLMLPAPVAGQSRPVTRAAASGGAGGGAWSLPEPAVLVERVLARIVSQDKPGGVPMNSYAQRFVGRDETIDAVRRFAGRSIDLPPSAFSAVSGWTDARMVAFPKCAAAQCPPTDNAVWLAVTRIDRGDLPHEVNVWYTTNFVAYTEAGVQKSAYAFCERWLRVGGVWRYDGFIRVNSVGVPG